MPPRPSLVPSLIISALPCAPLPGRLQGDWLSSYWAGFMSPHQHSRIRNTGVPMDLLKVGGWLAAGVPLEPQPPTPRRVLYWAGTHSSACLATPGADECLPLHAASHQQEVGYAVTKLPEEFTPHRQIAKVGWAGGGRGCCYACPATAAPGATTTLPSLLLLLPSLLPQMLPPMLLLLLLLLLQILLLLLLLQRCQRC